jgi:hypothetical protein
VRLEGIGELKKPTYLIGNETCDLSACNIMYGDNIKMGLDGI